MKPHRAASGQMLGLRGQLAISYYTERADNFFHYREEAAATGTFFGCQEDGALRSEATRGDAEYQVWYNFSRTLYD